MQCIDAAEPVTGLFGFIYSPEGITDPFFQMPLAFQPTQGSQYESPVGSGHMVKFPQTNFTEPQGAHAIQASAGNKVFSAYSDLTKPLSGLSTMDPKALTLNPFGMKPVGFNWAPGTPVLAGEICTPSTPTTGNGHTYQAMNAGTTAAQASQEPIWPLTESGTVNDNGIVWQEHTMVIANRLPPPSAPVLTLAGGGGFAINEFVYVMITFLNRQGETLPSTPVLIKTLAGSSSVNVPIPALAQLAGWIRGLAYIYVPTAAKVYVASAPVGGPVPPQSEYQLYGSSVALGTVVNVTTNGTGAAPPTVCSARVTPGQLPTPTTIPDIQRVPAGSVVNPPAVPAVVLGGSGSSFTAGQQTYLAFTLVNANGETTPSPPLGSNPYGLSVVIQSNGQGIEVIIGNNYGLSVTGMNVYIWNGGAAAPNFNRYNATPYPLGTTQTILGLGSGPYFPLVNTATLPTGSFPAGRDVYVAQTYTNAQGETTLGPLASVINTNADDFIAVTVSYPLGPNNEQLYTISSVGIYEADVATGTPAPNPSAFALVGYYQSGATPFILDTATGGPPPITNTTGPGGAIAADTSTGGANGTQGYRYAAFGWINQMETFSGFTEASVVSTIIDLDGYEIGVFNVPTGPPNIVGRYIPFSIADGTQAGPFNWIGLVDLQVPSQNVVYPQQTLVFNVQQSATVFLDNTTTSGIFNFTDSYLVNSNNVDDRLDITIPPQGVRVDYLAGLDRLAITGVPGYSSGTWISLEADYESFYGDLSPVPISSAGDVCYGVTDVYKGIPFALMKSGGFSLGANTGDPSSWSAIRRWGGTDPGQQLGPCGFRAWSACGKFIIFAHRSGLYKYSESDPDMMSKEVPKLWSTINWAAGDTISVTIDEDTHTVHVLVPTGSSMVPNADFVLSYIEGWNNPIHFSTFSGREISMDAARRWSPSWTVSAFICLRMERTLPPGGNAYLNGPSFETLPDSSFALTQLLFASSGGDGTVQARTPGIFSDNGSGIPWQYETMSSGMMQAVCKPEGFNLNACGQGICIPSFVASREMVTDEGGEPKLIQEEEEVMMDQIALSPKQVAGITRKCTPAVNEFWRPRFNGDGQPGTWISLKAMTSYVIPFTFGRDPGDR